MNKGAMPSLQALDAMVKEKKVKIKVFFRFVQGEVLGSPGEKKWYGHNHSPLTTVGCNTKGEVELLSAWGEAAATKLKSCGSHLEVLRTSNIYCQNSAHTQGSFQRFFKDIFFSVRIELRILDLERKNREYTVKFEF